MGRNSTFVVQSWSVAVDEYLVPFRGYCPFQQCMPNKPAKYGIEIWAACDAKSSYAWIMQVYTGKLPAETSEKNQGMHVVLEMNESLQGHKMACNNLFTSYCLGDELQKRKLTMLRTVRWNKPKLPREILKMRGKISAFLNICFQWEGNSCFILPKEKQDCSCNEHKAHRWISEHKRWHEDTNDPGLHQRGGIDNLDKVIATYSCQHKTAC